MEIDVTHMVNERQEMCLLSGSQAEWGGDAAKFTWDNSQRYAELHPLIDTDEKHAAAVEYFEGFGAWDDLDKWPREEINALATQHVAGSLREYELYADDEGDLDWDEIEKSQQGGRINSDIFRGDDGKFYFYMGT